MAAVALAGGWADCSVERSQRALNCAVCLLAFGWVHGGSDGEVVSREGEQVGVARAITGSSSQAILKGCVLCTNGFQHR